MLLKGNSRLIIPQIITDKSIFNTSFVSADSYLVLDNLYIILIYKKEHFPYKKIIAEPSFYNINKTRTGYVVKFLVPKDKFMICNLMYKTGYDIIPRETLYNSLIFWYNKTPTARESSRGLFFIQIFSLSNFHNIYVYFLLHTIVHINYALE